MTESPTVAHSVEERLRRIESVTGWASAHRDLADLLETALDRVREVLAVDTAAVLMLDGSGSQLVATAARGLEEEVRQGVRIPVGQGFAGRIAATQRPVIIEDVAHSAVLNPVLREKGVRSLLGVPLVHGGAVIGVLHVGSLRSRTFAPEEVELLQQVADRVAVTALARQSDAEQAATVALQRSLVPAALPIIHGLELAARYVPGEDHAVGGDWYDVFSLPGGYVGLTIGDVAGRGLRAAVIMGRLRSVLRAYALETHDPAEVLTRLDTKFQYFEPREMATVLYAVFDPTLERINVSSAGHPPPVVATPHQPTVHARVAPDPPLGVPMDAARHSTTIFTPPGTALCFYTDGLVERRLEPLDPRVQMLREIVAADEPERVCASVMFSLIGKDRADDDVALLVVRREAPAPHVRLELPARPRSLAAIRALSRRWFAAHRLTPQEFDDVLVALGEACTNAVEHAYGSREGAIVVELELRSDDVVMTVRDTGHWRRPRGRHRGRGMTVMEHCSDQLDIERSAAGTTVTMRHRLAARRRP